MKKIILFILALYYIPMYANRDNTELEVRNVYYICIDILPQNNYPILFDVLLDINDTLELDISSREDFIHSVLRNSQYVPRYWDEDVFTETYGESYRNTKHNFSHEFHYQMRKFKHWVKVRLSSGENVVFSYMKVKGVFVHCDKEINYSTGLSSPYYPEVSKPYIPFAVTEYSESNITPIRKKNSIGQDILFVKGLEE